MTLTQIYNSTKLSSRIPRAKRLISLSPQKLLQILHINLISKLHLNYLFKHRRFSILQPINDQILYFPHLPISLILPQYIWHTYFPHSMQISSVISYEVSHISHSAHSINHQPVFHLTVCITFLWNKRIKVTPISFGLIIFHPTTSSRNP